MATHRKVLPVLALTISLVAISATWRPARALAFPSAPVPVPTATPNPLSRTPVPLPIPTATPTPAPRATAIPAPVQTPRLPITPSGLHVTSSVAECQQHQGNFACGALGGGALTITVLVWNGEAAAGAYTVYRLDGAVGGLHQAVKVGANTGMFNGVIPSAFSLNSVAAGACYAVTETIGTNESSLSAPVCPGASAKTNTLNAVHVMAYTFSDTSKCTAVDFGGTFGGSNGGGSNGVLQVGYQNVASTCHGYGGLTSGQIVSGSWATGAVFFDVTRFSGHGILKAMLELPVASGSTSPQSCAQTVSNGAAYWWASPAEPAVGAPSLDATVLAGAVDVTSLVSAWVLGPDHGGVPNFGFVLQGAHRDDDFTVGTCLTTYGPPTLVVTYQ